MFNVFNMLQY